jgi:MSHA biogenesis protein MshJ
MKGLWRLVAGRIDALSLRERALIFWTVLICGLVAGDQLLLEPAQERQQQLVATVRQQSGELDALRAQLGAGKPPAATPNSVQAVRAQIDEVQKRIEGVNRQIEQLSRLGGVSDPLPRVLLHILRRYEGLTLEHTVTLAPVPTQLPPQGGEAAASLMRHGMEFTVTGAYGDLMRYVQTLEQELPALRWGSMRLSSGKPAPKLTLQVFWLGGAP